MKKLTLLLVLLMLPLLAIAYDNDLAAVSLTGPTSPRSNQQSLYTITIFNPGTNPQTTYQVRLLVSGGIEVFNWAGPMINAGATQTMTLPWIPDHVGPETLYGEIVLASDQYSANNQTAGLPIVIQAARSIGNGDQQAYVPVNMYYCNSLFETIYYAQEMVCAGQITAICFHNNFDSVLFDKPTNIWLGTTTLQDLSGGWIPASQLTQVFSGNVNYPSGQNEIVITLTTPFQYNGGNLVMMVQRPWDNDYYSSMDRFYSTTVGTNRSLATYNDNTTINPDNPPTTGVTGQFPYTTFIFSPVGLGGLHGTVTSGVSPLVGATVSINNTPLQTVTGIGGVYAFSFLPQGTYLITAVKTGYAPMTHTVVISEYQTVTQDFVLTPISLVSVSGRVLGSDAPTVGIPNAEVSLSGYAPYQTSTDNLGNFTLPGVYENNIYILHIEAAGYQDYTQEINAGTTNLTLGNIYLNEMAYPPRNVTATESGTGNSVLLTWDAPSAAQEGWLHYDNGENFNSFGTAGSLSFDVAIRYPASVLAPYAGASLQAVKIWPAQGGNFSVRVWTGGDAANPGEMVVDQPIIPILNSYNTIMLNEPVYITGTEELWFGFLCDVTGVNPAYAGVDPGPAVNGFSNMIYWQGNWTTLLAVNSFCDFNWNIQGYAGLDAPDGIVDLTLIKSAGQPWQNDPGDGPERNPVYKAWRLLQGQENNEAGWTSLTPNAISETNFQDSNWSALPDGTYLWAVKAIYLNNVLSEPVFSNPLTKTIQVGSIAGIVRNMQNVPLMNATITCGSVTATTNNSGAYSMMVEAGTHSISASHAGYQTATYDGIVVLTGETTHVNFQLLTNSLNDDPNGIPLATDLTGISPNPFRTGTSVSYALKESAPLSIDIYNLRGQLVLQIVRANTPAGYHSVDWDGRDASGNAVSAGVYFCRMSAGKETFTRRLVLLK